MKTVICIPTYNEINNIGKLVDRLLRLDSDVSILVIDDSSPDGTPDFVKSHYQAEPRVQLLLREKKEGIGPAYVAGFKWAIKNGFDAVIEMDADLSHRPRYIPEFIKRIKDYDIVVGSRWMPGGKIVNWSFWRVLLSRFANIYSRWILGVQVRDLTGGFICYRKEVLEAIELDHIHSDGYSFQIEMKYRALLKGFSLYEIPILFTDRQDGTSKISKKIVYEALLIVWFLRFKNKKLFQKGV